MFENSNKIEQDVTSRTKLDHKYKQMQKSEQNM